MVVRYVLKNTIECPWDQYLIAMKEISQVDEVLGKHASGKL